MWSGEHGYIPQESRLGEMGIEMTGGLWRTGGSKGVRSFLNRHIRVSQRNQNPPDFKSRVKSKIESVFRGPKIEQDQKGSERYTWVMWDRRTKEKSIAGEYSS